MNYHYYLFRNNKTKEAEAVFATLTWLVTGNIFEEITKAQYETYKEFGMLDAKLDKNGNLIR